MSARLSRLRINILKFLCIIQARLTSTRLPGKVLKVVNGRTILRRVWDAAKGSKASKVVVAWPERYPDLDEKDVRERFRRISREFPSQYIIRLTSDCPLLTPEIINKAIDKFIEVGRHYYCNRHEYQDGFDVQVFSSHMLHASYATNREHVIKPGTHFTPAKFLSVDTAKDLENVRSYARKNER